MGYCMDQRDNKFFIKADKKADALAAIKKLAETVQENGGGGVLERGGGWKRHYSWVNTKDFVEAETLADALNEWRWEIEENNDGDVNGIQFVGEKLGDDNFLFDAIAPFVQKGSFIEMQGEDGTMWRWSFTGKTCKEQDPTIIWE